MPLVIAHSRYKLPVLVLGAAIVVASIFMLALFTGLIGSAGMQHRNASAVGAEPAAATATDTRGASLPTLRAESDLPLADRAVCAICGRVQAVRPFEIRSDTNSADKQVGDATLVPRVAYRVTIHMDDGSYRTISQATRPTVVPGARVRLVDGVVTPM